MKFIPNAVSTKVARTVLLSQKHSPQTLFVGGLAGMGATIVLACRATLKVDEILEETQKKLLDVQEVSTSVNFVGSYSDRDVKKDKAIIFARAGFELTKLYGPTFLCGAVSVMALAGSHNILNKRNAALAAAYGTVSKAFEEYRERVQRELGAEREKELYYDVVPCEIDDPDDAKKKKVVKQSRGTNMYARLFDEHNKNWEPTPEYNLVFLKAQQNYMNDRLQAYGHVFLNEVYDHIGIERSKEGAVVGWIKNGADNFIDFGIFDNTSDKVVDFMTGHEKSIWLDFNVDGVIYDKI